MATPISYKGSDIISDALQKLGIYAPGEQIPDSDMSRGLVILNDMMDQWQNEPVFVYSLTQLTLNLAQGAGAYSIGPVGSLTSIATGRPNRIQSGPGAASVANGNTITPVNVVSQLQWNAIQSRNQIPGTPDTLFYDPQYPVGILNVSPVPNLTTLGLTFYSLVPFYSFATYNTAAMFSQGTADALKDNLAVSAKSYFADNQLDQIISARATVAKEFLRNNGTTSRAMLKRSPVAVGKPSPTPAGP